MAVWRSIRKTHVNELYVAHAVERPRVKVMSTYTDYRRVFHCCIVEGQVSHERVGMSKAALKRLREVAIHATIAGSYHNCSDAFPDVEIMEEIWVLKK
jgi:hypothetical protein